MCPTQSRMRCSLPERYSSARCILATKKSINTHPKNEERYCRLHFDTLCWTLDVRHCFRYFLKERRWWRWILPQRDQQSNQTIIRTIWQPQRRTILNQNPFNCCRHNPYQLDNDEPPSVPHLHQCVEDLQEDACTWV